VWRDLEVHTAQSARGNATSHVDLSDSAVEPGACEFIGAPLPGKEAALVAPRLDVNHEYAGKARLRKDHRWLTQKKRRIITFTLSL
jgi:hypothetical protein